MALRPGWPNRYLKQIARLVGEQDQRRAVQVFVREKLRGVQSLEALACILGVDQIIEEKLPFEGGLFRSPGGKPVIKLNAYSSFVRKRFTLAHEIGHLLLGTLPAHRSACQVDPALERACNLLATEFLMPSEEAATFIRGLGSPSPEKLRTIASTYKVSLRTAAIRVHDELGLWRCFIGTWERPPEIPEIKVEWFVGQRRWDAVEIGAYSFDLAVSSEGPVKTDELWRRGAFTEPVWLYLLRISMARVIGLIDFVN